MPHAQTITLLTDYGLTDEYVGVCHGVIARITPEARVIDLTHSVPRQDVRAGALTLARSLLYLPVGIHVAVVDPGVGGKRRAVALRLADRRILVGPDNGLLWPASRLGGGIEQAVEISNSQFRIEPVSATFHGRDIFAPVAAALARGVELDDAGERVDPASLATLETPSARVADGAVALEVIGIDEFGNAQLGGDAAALAQIGVLVGDDVAVTGVAPVDGVADGDPLVVRVARTFADVPHGHLMLHEDSAGWLALAVNHGSAADQLGFAVGDELRISGR